MPWTKSGAGPGQDFQRSGANPTIFYFFSDLVRGKLLVVRGRCGASVFSRYGAWFCVKFSKIGAKRTCNRR